MYFVITYFHEISEFHTFYIIHLFLGGGISSYLYFKFKRYEHILNKYLDLVVVLITALISSTSSILITALLITRSPLNRLPGGLMDGGLVITYPIILIIFTGTYFLVNIYAIKLINHVRGYEI
jgi:hypothetical protein